MNVSSFSITAPPVFAGNIPNGNWVEFSNNSSFFSDNFGLISRRSVDNTLANPDLVDDDGNVNLFDDSLGVFTGDEFGIIADNDFGNFFGIVDTANQDTGFVFAGDRPDRDSIFNATWEFDVTGAADGLMISIDFAAMGDFEFRSETFGDILDFEYSFDGVNFSPAFSSGILDTDYSTANVPFVNPIDTDVPGQGISELPIEVIYTMDNGTQVAYNDPMTINGEPIVNEFRTISFDGIGAPTSNTLTLRLTASIDSGSEVAAFRNIVIVDGIPEPTTLSLVVLAATTAFRRR